MKNIIFWYQEFVKSILDIRKTSYLVISRIWIFHQTINFLYNKFRVPFLYQKMIFWYQKNRFCDIRNSFFFISKTRFFSYRNIEQTKQVYSFDEQGRVYQIWKFNDLWSSVSWLGRGHIHVCHVVKLCLLL